VHDLARRLDRLQRPTASHTDTSVNKQLLDHGIDPALISADGKVFIEGDETQYLNTLHAIVAADRGQ
jgi:hypothetical protein